jgi:phosphoribosylamine--glycine ligase/phosphoribosylformylglycinamidine cyclo-ligase
VRFGDPETQSLMALLSPETDLAEILLVSHDFKRPAFHCKSLTSFTQACVERRLDCIKVEMKKEFAVSVVLASKGYPGAYGKGVEITFDTLPKGVSTSPSSERGP